MIEVWILPVFIFIIFICAYIRKVNSYQVFVDGVKDGLKMFYDLYPALLSMMFAIALLKESHVMDFVCNTLSSIISVVPKAVWPMMLFRPLSGNASFAVLADIFQNEGVDSFAGIMGSMIEGATDTTFYVITLYFSTVGVTKLRNAISTGLIADVIGMTLAIILTFLVFS